MLTLAQRYAVLHLFHKRLGYEEATDEMNDVYGEATVGKTAIWRWYKRFESGDFDVQDKQRSGRPSEFDDESLKKLVEEQPRTTVRELSQLMKASPSTVHRHLLLLGKVGTEFWLTHCPLLTLPGLQAERLGAP